MAGAAPSFIHIDSTGKLEVDATYADAGSVVKLTMRGRVDTDNSHTLTRSLSQLLEHPTQPKRVVIDMTDVSYLASSGIGCFVGFLVACNKRSIGLELLNVAEAVRQVFEVLGFGKFFTFG
jgi:anti-sigma B factor antagonist